MADPTDRRDSERTSGMRCLVRCLWRIGGSVIAVISALAIARNRGTFLRIADGAFWGAVIAAVRLRDPDGIRFGGTTATGEPATIRHGRRHAVILVVMSTAGWPPTPGHTL